MCSVSASPVMKMTGTLERPASRLSRRQVSKPSMPGIMASSRMMSGVIWSTMRMAAAPSSATMTVMPAVSSASVSRRRVSGESSTTSATSRFLDSMVIGMQGFQGCHVLVEVEAIDQGTHLRYEVGVFGEVAADLIQLGLDRADIAELSKPDQFFDMPERRSRSGIRPPTGRRDRLVGVIAPFELEKLADGPQQPWNIDRLHQIAVVEGLRQRCPVRFQRARRDHQNAGLAMSVRTQRLRHFPAIHARHGNIQQEQIGPAMLRQGETGRPVRRAQQDEAERREYFAQEIALYRIVIGDQDGLA